MSSGSKLPMGVRFCPTDEELINYLKRFVLRGQLPSYDAIKVADLFGELQPWQIFGANSKEKARYFFSKLKNFKNSKIKFARTVGEIGTWKGQNSDEPIKDHESNKVIGFKRSLKYQTVKEKDQRDRWLMKEYALEKNNSPVENNKDIVVLCKIEDKKAKEKTDNLDKYEVTEGEVDEVIANLLGNNSHKSMQQPSSSHDQAGVEQYWNRSA